MPSAEANDDSVIADVSETLRLFLRNGLSRLVVPPQVVVHNLRSKPQPPSLSLFLYDLQEDPSTRNRPRQRVPVGAAHQIRRPNLPLQLRYLLTPWVDDDNLAYPYTDQVILARVAQLFHDNAILTGSVLFGELLAAQGASLSVSRTPLSLEDQTHIWRTLDLPYRLSFVYEVRVATIRSEVFDLAAPVTSRSVDNAMAGGGAS